MRTRDTVMITFMCETVLHVYDMNKGFNLTKSVYNAMYNFKQQIQNIF